MKRNDPIAARDLATDAGIELSTLLVWLRRNGHDAINGGYQLGEASEAQVRAHIDELIALDAERRTHGPHRMPPRPGRPTSSDNPFRGRQG